MCLALDRGRPGFIRNFTCSALLGCFSARLMDFTYGAFTLCGLMFQLSSIIHKFSYLLRSLQIPHEKSRYPACTTPAGLTYKRFWLLPFRSPLLGVSLTISFPPVTEMFHFTGCRSLCSIYSNSGDQILVWSGYPIRKSTDHSVFAAPRSLSQLITSFIACWHQGILHTNDRSGLAAFSMARPIRKLTRSFWKTKATAPPF